MPKKYNHMIDVAFTVVSEQEDFEKLTHEEVLNGMERRLKMLRENPDPEAFGLCDTYEED